MMMVATLEMRAPVSCILVVSVVIPTRASAWE